MGTKKFALVTLTWKFALLLKNFNIGHSFSTRRGKTFIFHMYVPCDKNFLCVPKFILTLTLKFDLLTKNFYLGHNFWTWRGRAFIFTCAFLVIRPCTLYYHLWSSDLYLAGWPSFQKFCSGLWLLNQWGYLLLRFTCGCGWRAMLSFWQLWFELLAAESIPLTI